jgi:hypothetical protein
VKTVTHFLTTVDWYMAGQIVVIACLMIALVFILIHGTRRKRPW